MTDVVEKGHLEARARLRRQGQLEEALGTIRDDWDDAAHPLAGDGGVHVHTAPTSRPPFDIAPLSVLDEATRCLRSWAQLVADERNITTPNRNLWVLPDGRVGNTGRNLAHFLSLHAEWLAAHPTADDAVRELRLHAANVHAVAVGRRVQRVRLGACPERHVVDGEPTRDPCPGTLYALIRQDDNGLLPDRVQCDRNRDHVWAPWQWPNLGRRMGNLDPTGVHRLINRLAATRYRSE